MPRLTDRAAYAALAAFLLVDVVLVGLAVSSTGAASPGGGRTIDVAVATPRASTPAGPTSNAPSGSTRGARTEVAVAPLSAGIVAIDATTALRYRAGSCAARGSTLEITHDGGKTWSPRSVPYDAVSRIRVRPDGSAFAVGAQAATDCTPAIRHAPAYEGAWGDSVAVKDAWYRDPRDPKSVGLPKGGHGQPCGGRAVIDLAVVDKGAAALCANGEVRLSRTGAGWTTAGSAPGALAIAQSSTGRAFLVLPGVGACSGLAIVDAAKRSVALGCVLTDLAAVQPGEVALAVAPGAGWLLVGPDVYRSDGSLTAWHAA